MENSICYGDVLYVECNDFLLFANGFFDPNAYFVLNSKIALKSFRNGLFKIYPNFSYKDASQIDELKVQLALLSSLNTKKKDALDEIQRDLDNEQLALEEREAKLNLLNDKIYRELKGHPIRYGQKFQLKHVESKAFLSVSKLPITQDKTMNSLELIQPANKNAYFVFMPILSFIQTGEVVEYNTPLKIISPKLELSIVIGPEVKTETFQIDLNPATMFSANDDEMIPPLQPRRREPLALQERVSRAGLKTVEVPDNILIRRFLTNSEKNEKRKRKTLNNGDYIRITNDVLDLTIYQNRKTDILAFQAYGFREQVKRSYAYTVFQILDLGTPDFTESDDLYDALYLPRSTPLEPDEKKRFMLKHVISGKVLVFDEKTLKFKIEEFDKSTDSAWKVSINVKNKSKDLSKGKYVDRNSVLQLNFHKKDDVHKGALVVGDGVKLPNVQLDTNTWYFFGFAMGDNYLNKILRAERFNLGITQAKDDKNSYLKFSELDENESGTFFYIESFCNQLLKFYGFIDEFKKTETTITMKSLNNEIKKLTDICTRFEKTMYEESSIILTKDLLTPSKTVQFLLRELRGIELIYRIFLELIIGEKLRDKADNLQKNAKVAVEKLEKLLNLPKDESSEIKDDVHENAVHNVPKSDEVVLGGNLNEKTEENTVKPEEVALKEEASKAKPTETEAVPDVNVLKETINGNNVTVDYEQLLELIKIMKAILLVCIKKNHTNRNYCSQFIRIPINGIFSTHEGLFNLAKEEHFHDECRKPMLILLKKGLWDKDLDALGQLNFYEATAFESIEVQKNFHSIYLKILQHMALSKAPNLQNLIIDNFLYKFLSKVENLKHVFPVLFEEDNKFYLEFTRKKCPENNFKIALEDLDEKLIGQNTSKDAEKNRVREATTYFISALELIISLAFVNRAYYNMKIAKYYRYESLSRAMVAIKNSTKHRMIKLNISKVIATIHQQFFKLPYLKVPAKLQVLNETVDMTKTLKEMNNMIKDAINTSISSSEINYMKEEDVSNMLEPLKELVSYDNTNEVQKLLETKVNIKKLDDIRMILEEIRKVLDATNDVNINFLKSAHNVIISLIKDAIQQKNSKYFESIKIALEVFSEIENKIISYATNDIVASLQNLNQLGNRNINFTDFKDEDKLAPGLASLKAATFNLKKQVLPMDMRVKQLSTRVGKGSNVMKNAIEMLSKDWKSKEKLRLVDDSNIDNILMVEAAYKQFNTEEIVITFFNILLLKEDSLHSEAIQGLKRIASYESLLYSELNKISILHEAEALNKVKIILKATFRLKEIEREVCFCKDNLIEIKADTIKNFLDEVHELVWKIFFTIYDPALHFECVEEGEDSEKRFREAFLDYKKVRWDQPLKINHKAINRPFQKVFNIIKTYDMLFKTLAWVLDKKVGFTDEYLTHSYIIRLIITTITVFINNNKEHQDLFAQFHAFIRSFYNQHFINQSCDGMLTFNELFYNNKKLLKLPIKYLYDITMSTFVGSTTRQINNYETNSYLAATIVCFSWFLTKCNVPREVFDPVKNLRSKWKDVAVTAPFNKLDVANYTEIVTKVPYTYYSIRELMVSTIDSIDQFSRDIKQVNIIQNFLAISDWLGFFECGNYLFQYELKNILTQCISKIYFHFGKKGTLIQNFDECVSLISCLSYEFLSYMLYTAEKENQNISELSDLRDSSNFITTNEHYLKIKGLYAQKTDIDFQGKKLQIYLEAFSLHYLRTRYIYEGCLELIFDIIIDEDEYCSQLAEDVGVIKSVVGYVLNLLDAFIQLEQNKPNFPYERIEKFLNRISGMKDYKDYKDKIVHLTNNLYEVKKKEEKQTEETNSGIITPLDSFNQHIEQLKRNKKRIKEQNIKEIAHQIYESKESTEIIKKIFIYINKDLNKLDMTELKFLLRLLRKYVELLNTNNQNDDPIYKWKEVNIIDLKKIARIQTLYRSLGLTDVIFKFLMLGESKIYKETLLLSLAYMYGGNIEIQEEFFAKFVSDDSNKVLKALSERLEAIWDSFRQKETRRERFMFMHTQKKMFEIYGKVQIDDDKELQISLLGSDIDPKYLQYAEDDSENNLLLIILSFLQSLCEGQFTKMQLFLREQKYQNHTYTKSFDFVEFLRHSVNTFHKILNKYNLSIGDKILNLINELIQGEAYENIARFLQKTFINDMCRILTDYNVRFHTLPRGFGLNPFQEDFRSLKSNVLNIFKIMLENKNEANNKILNQHLDTKGLMNMFDNLMNYFMNNKGLNKNITDTERFISSLTNEDFKSTLGDAINIYIIFRYIWPDLEVFRDKMRGLINSMDKDSQDHLNKLVFIVFKRLVNSIEIQVQNKQEPLMRIWYPVLAVCNYLSDDTKFNFTQNVDRSNGQTKIFSLISAANEFIPQMYTDYKARNRIFGFNPMFLFTICRVFSNALALAIVCTNIGTYQYNRDDESTSQDTSSNNIIYALNAVQIALAAILVFLWVLLYRKRYISFMWERYVENNIKAYGFLPPTIKRKVEEGRFEALSEEDCRQIMTLKGANSDEFKEMKVHAPNFVLISKLIILRDIIFLVTSRTLIWHIFYLGIAIGSLFHPIVAIFQLFDIAIRSDNIKQITTAVSKNKNQFLWTLFLLGVVTVVYSSIGFYFLNDAFKANDSNLCDTAFACFVNTLNMGLRSGGGIGDVIGTQPYMADDVGKFFGRAIFDLSFFVIMIILLLNLIFGMIIDAFGELRDRKSSNEDDEKNTCFMCGIARSEFEKHINFEEHVVEEHNMWAYVNYIVYLNDKQKTAKIEMTDIETLVLGKIDQKDFTWIPSGKSLTLEKVYKQEKEEKNGELDEVLSAVQSIHKMVTTISYEIKSGLEK